MSAVGRKVPEPTNPPEPEYWLQVEGKPHLRRSSKTGQLRTYIAENEDAQPFPWPNYHPEILDGEGIAQEWLDYFERHRRLTFT